MAKLLPVTLVIDGKEANGKVLYKNHVSNIDSADPFLYLAILVGDEVNEFEFYYLDSDEQLYYRSYLKLKETQVKETIAKLNINNSRSVTISIDKDDRSVLVHSIDDQRHSDFSNLVFRDLRHNKRKITQSEIEDFDLVIKEDTCESGITSSYAWDEAQGRLNLFLCSLNSVAKALRKSYELPKIAEVEVRFKNGLIITTDKLKKK